MAQESSSVSRVHASFQVRRVGKSRGRSTIHFHGDTSSEIGPSSVLQDPNPRESQVESAIHPTLELLRSMNQKSVRTLPDSYQFQGFRINTKIGTSIQEMISMDFNKPSSKLNSIKIMRSTGDLTNIRQTLQSCPSLAELPLPNPSQGLERNHISVESIQEPISSRINTVRSIESLPSGSESTGHISNPQKKNKLNLRFLRLLGRGANSTVHVAFDELLRKKVAVKIIRKKTSAEEHSRQYQDTLEEVSILSKSQGPGIIEYYRFSEDEIRVGLCLIKYYIVTEYIENAVTLSEFTEMQPFKTLLEEQIKLFTIKLLQILSDLHHKGVAHLDLKPQNILITHELDLKLIDFGSAGLLSHGKTTGKGTRGYTAPETIFTFKSKIDLTKVDVWGIGCIIHRAYFGYLPQCPYEISKATTGIQNFISTCLKISPSERSCPKKLMQHPWLL